jgi:hypothetical protein
MIPAFDYSCIWEIQSIYHSFIHKAEGSLLIAQWHSAHLGFSVFLSVLHLLPPITLLMKHTPKP